MLFLVGEAVGNHGHCTKTTRICTAVEDKIGEFQEGSLSKQTAIATEVEEEQSTPQDHHAIPWGRGSRDIFIGSE